MMPSLMNENSLVFDQVLGRARKSITTVRECLSDLSCSLGTEFARCVVQIAEAKGNILFTGVGKSACVATKLAATFASLGMPSFFLHPVDMGHGDLGSVTSRDVLVIISYSGETSELLSLMHCFKSRAAALVALVRHKDSSIARLADFCLEIGSVDEICHLGLAPTTSTTASFVLGDVLAVCAAELKGFKKEDFARSHPNGRLGQLLTLRIKDVMLSRDRCALVQSDASVFSSVLAMAQCGQSVAVIEQAGDIIGTQPMTLVNQAKMIDASLQTVSNRHYVIPATLKLQQSLLLKEALAMIGSSADNFFPVFDDDGVFVGLFDASSWKH